MINMPATYQAAVIADSRRVRLRAVVNIIDPDIVYGAVTSSGETIYSDTAQLHDMIFDLGAPFATLEHNRWLLNGGFDIEPPSGQVGFESDLLFDANGEGNIWVQMSFSGIDILQSCVICFPDDDFNGFPVDLTIEIMQGGTAYHTETITGNENHVIRLQGFTVYYADAIKVTVTRWSLPNRRMRIPEIVAGTHEVWDGDMLAEFSLTHQGTVNLASLPYGTCSLSMDNQDRRFEPRNPSGLFQSIEDRQGIEVYIGVDTPGGTEYVPSGVFYQYNEGWKTGDNGLTMNWDLVDIIGLLNDREFVLAGSLPTTLEGWVQEIVAQLGVNFASNYVIEPGYETTSATVSSADAVAGVSCGELLLWLCQATLTYPRADAETGFLRIEPFKNDGVNFTLDNMTIYPIMKSNPDIAWISFTMPGGSTVTIPGTSTSSPNSLSIKNPFIRNATMARATAQMMLETYGGNQIEVTGRGDPSSEIGDTPTVQLDESSATTGRLSYQDFSFSGGVMQGCKSVLIRGDGSFLYENRAVITTSGTWTGPAGVTDIRLVLIGKGADGADGTAGSYDSAGTRGANGKGGKVWAQSININDGQSFTVTIGADTVFGLYSSANGVLLPSGYTDIMSGDVYARTGIDAPAAGSGDGGAGGAAGMQGRRHLEKMSEDDPGLWWSDVSPTYGGRGVPGATGCAIVYWGRS